MFSGPKFSIALILAVLAATPANALTAELAKKCQALTIKAFPPRAPGNPAAGSAKGSGQQINAYYKKCLEADGKMDDQTTK
jgi:hypothetical protein